MPSSPTIDTISSNFNSMRKRLGIGTVHIVKHYYIILLLYPFIIISILMSFRPRIVLDDKQSLSYKKLILWFIVLQIPLFLYYLLNQK